jgi:ferritin-like metal-binding protein YciE
MKVETLEDLYVEQLRDLYNAETQVQNALQTWLDAARSDMLRELFADRLKQANRHISRVQQICSAMQVNPAGEKCHGMEGLIEEGAEYIDDSTESPVRDAGLIANAQRVEHYGIAGYGCARTYARQLGYDEAAAALQKNVDESAEMDERMTKLAEQLLNPEAMATGASA